MRQGGRYKTKSIARAIATLAVVLVAVSGLVLVSGAQAADGVTCSPGESSLTMSWSGDTFVFQYTAYVKNSSDQEMSKILAWRSKSGTASVTFSSLALDTYTVWVVKQTNEGKWIKFGEQSCTVSTAAPTPAPGPNAEIRSDKRARHHWLCSGCFIDNSDVGSSVGDNLLGSVCGAFHGVSKGGAIDHPPMVSGPIGHSLQ